MHIKLEKRGLFITGTCTDIGKTIVTSAIATILHEQGAIAGVSKPVATGCIPHGDSMLSEDAQILNRHTPAELSFSRINPVQYAQPMAPAVAAKHNNEPLNARAIKRALQKTDAETDVQLIEGIGGILVPLSSRTTILDLAVAIGYPVLVVTRPDLGTLNHTALTCQAIQNAGLPLAGIVINRFDPNTDSPAEKTCPTWLAKQSHTRILAKIPYVKNLNPMQAPLPEAILHPFRSTNWRRICKRQIEITP